MMEDIVGDYADKTVTLEDFPLFEHGIKMASVHPCKHAPVMKALLDRADAALKIRLGKIRKAAAAASTTTTTTTTTTGNEAESKARHVDAGMEGLVDDLDQVRLREDRGFKHGVAAAGGAGGDEWEVLDESGAAAGVEEEEVAIRVDQYLVVFLKFMASVTPGIEHDFTMGV